MAKLKPLIVCGREIAMIIQPIDNRSNGDSFSATAIHYRCEISLPKGEKRLHPFVIEYSCGFGIAEQWARKNTSKFLGNSYVRDFLKNPLSFGKRWRDDSEYVQTVRRVASKHFRPDKMDVLMSCVMDAQTSDQSFEDWADDLGYDLDSISAKKIWEECNRIRRSLDKILTAQQWEYLQELDW